MSSVENSVLKSQQNDFKPNYTAIVEDYRKKASTYETFIIFKIVTNKIETFEVERRYNDFIWLEYNLSEKYPVLILPPLPQKHNLTTIERFERSFLEQRKIALSKYLLRLSKHVIVSDDDLLWQFLTLPDSEFENLKMQYPVPGRLESLRNSLSQFSFNSSKNSIDSKSAHFLNPKNEKIIKHSSDLADVMHRLGRVNQRTCEVWKKDLGSRVYSNEDLREINGGWRYLEQYGRNCESIGIELVEELDPWVEESALYWEHAARSIKRRDAAEEKCHNYSSGDSPVGNVTLTKDGLFDEFTKKNAELESETDRFLEERDVETRKWLSKFAEMHIKHYKEENEIWTKIQHEIMRNSSLTSN